MKRHESESVDDYKKHRAAENKAIKLHLTGKRIKYTYKEFKKLWEAKMVIK